MVIEPNNTMKCELRFRPVDLLKNTKINLKCNLLKTDIEGGMLFFIFEYTKNIKFVSVAFKREKNQRLRATVAVTVPTLNKWTI